MDSVQPMNSEFLKWHRYRDVRRWNFLQYIAIIAESLYRDIIFIMGKISW